LVFVGLDFDGAFVDYWCDFIFCLEARLSEQGAQCVAWNLLRNHRLHFDFCNFPRQDCGLDAKPNQSRRVIFLQPFIFAGHFQNCCCVFCIESACDALVVSFKGFRGGKVRCYNGCALFQPFV